ncbi:MAG: nuclear transport factor 2 family protein [Pseudomonadota bacterium]
MDQLTNEELKATRELLDKQAIYENVLKYCRGADRLDLELLKDSYWEDGTDDHGAFRGNAHEFCEFAVQSKGMFKSASHHVGNTQIELLGSQAKVETYFLSVQVMEAPDANGEQFWQLGGRYKDLYEKRAGQWKILHRTCIWDWSQFQDSRPEWSKFGLDSSPNRGAFAPDDPIYASWHPS